MVYWNLERINDKSGDDWNYVERDEQEFFKVYIRNWRSDKTQTLYGFIQKNCWGYREIFLFKLGKRNHGINGIKHPKTMFDRAIPISAFVDGKWSSGQSVYEIDPTDFKRCKKQLNYIYGA